MSGPWADVSCSVEQQLTLLYALMLAVVLDNAEGRDMKGQYCNAATIYILNTEQHTVTVQIVHTTGLVGNN